MVDGRRRLLVKAAGLGDESFSLSAEKVPGLREAARIEPLFKSIGRERGMAVAGVPAWHVLTTEDTERSPWDDCHALLSRGLSLDGADVRFAEPDIAQRWLAGDDRQIALALAADCGTLRQPSGNYPKREERNWWLEPQFSQLSAAAGEVAAIKGRPVRIAHFDTGYDPHHATLPEHVDTKNARNYVDFGKEEDATDTAPDHFANPGHGPATLALLAGKPVDVGDGRMLAIGGAPDAEVVPIRVANSVVLFYNSAVARAFDHVHDLCTRDAAFVDIITMSMGGIASQAWAEAVNALYDKGVFIVTAAGNNYGNLPTRNIVFPARFNRVLAACGVMADGAPYADLALTVMAGNYGPTDKMTTAMAAFTPNVGWARQGCPTTIDPDGNGTSSATPQLAAAAAHWIRRHRDALDKLEPPWRRAEAVRHALLTSARQKAKEDKVHLGEGWLQALDALQIEPKDDLKAQDEDRAYFSLLDTLIGTDLGIAEETDAEKQERRMFGLEALQLSQSAEVEKVLPDTDTLTREQLTSRDRTLITEALLARPGISQALSDKLRSVAVTGAKGHAPLPPETTQLERDQLARAMNPHIEPPTRRRLQVFAVDPSLGVEFETVGINRAVVDVRWEDDLRPGPVGEYVEVVDVDPASHAAYAPIDLNHPYLLPRDGLAPSEADPQFHQQMCYAVAMRTIESFEMALGRTSLWRPIQGQKGRQDRYVQRLRIYPHALRAANAYYSPDKRALLLGYFSADEATQGTKGFRGVHFAALSHDIIAHETTHALLDGLHPRFSEPTNSDVLAFHEAFADIIALFQHFTLPEALQHEIRKTRGDFDEQDSLLGQLAVDFGKAMSGGREALRSAIGKTDKDGVWRISKPQYDQNLEAHKLGSVLVSAVFAAYLKIYKARADELRRLATNGTGVLPEGDIPVALADRLAEEASHVAEQVMRMCIRALDYCPPVDITFGDYLRAIISADQDLVPDDPRGYRTAFASAFRDRGIFPEDVRHLSPDNLVWHPPINDNPTGLEDAIKDIDQTWTLDSDRRKSFNISQDNKRRFHRWIEELQDSKSEVLEALGLALEAPKYEAGAVEEPFKTQVHSVRPARRVGPDGQTQNDLVVEITQRYSLKDGTKVRGGCTILIDLKTYRIRYCITKRLSEKRVATQMKFQGSGGNGLRSNYFRLGRVDAELFAVLHNPDETLLVDEKDAADGTGH